MQNIENNDLLLNENKQFDYEKMSFPDRLSHFFSHFYKKPKFNDDSFYYLKDNIVVNKNCNYKCIEVYKDFSAIRLICDSKRKGCNKRIIIKYDGNYTISGKHSKGCEILTNFYNTEDVEFIQYTNSFDGKKRVISTEDVKEISWLFHDYFYMTQNGMTDQEVASNCYEIQRLVESSKYMLKVKKVQDEIVGAMIYSIHDDCYYIHFVVAKPLSRGGMDLISLLKNSLTKQVSKIFLASVPDKETYYNLIHGFKKVEEEENQVTIEFLS